jgi:hypothetical protein
MIIQAQMRRITDGPWSNRMPKVEFIVLVAESLGKVRLPGV